MEYAEYLSLREDILAWLEPRVKPSRFIHTMGVEQQAVSLARRYMPSDVSSASLAALLHDNAKNLPTEEQLELCKIYFPDQELTKEFAPILHAFAGAVEAQKRYPMLSDDIINAISFHTTGRPNMSTLEKIIYCADYAEPNREPFPGLEEARKMLYVDLDEGLKFILRQTSQYVSGKGKKIHPLTTMTMAFYEPTIKTKKKRK